MFFRKSAHVFLTVYFTCSNFEGYTESADVLDKILPKIWCHLKSHATDVHFQFWNQVIWSCLDYMITWFFATPSTRSFFVRWSSFFDRLCWHDFAWQVQDFECLGVSFFVAAAVLLKNAESQIALARWRQFSLAPLFFWCRACARCSFWFRSCNPLRTLCMLDRFRLTRCLFSQASVGSPRDLKQRSLQGFDKEILST